MMNIDTGLKITSLLISIAVFLQCLELILLRPYWAKSGIWDWNILKREYSNVSAKFFNLSMSDGGYFAVLMLGALSALLGMFTSNYLVLPLMFFVSLFTARRFRGTFNGGSDYMTILVLLVCSVSYLLPEYKELVFGYLALQIILSYFISGISKLKNSAWRDGSALERLITTSSYSVPNAVKPLANRKALMKTLSWALIVFEILAPLALLHPYLISVFIFLALAFHLTNFYILGLNRFVFAWAAAYPSLYWFCHFLNSHRN